MKEHRLKTWPDFFEAVWRGEKTFEIRKDDRGFAAGHRLLLQEWCPRCANYTGREIKADVPYCLYGGGEFGLQADHVCMALTGVELYNSPNGSKQ